MERRQDSVTFPLPGQGMDKLGGWPPDRLIKVSNFPVEILLEGRAAPPSGLELWMFITYHLIIADTIIKGY